MTTLGSQEMWLGRGGVMTEVNRKVFCFSQIFKREDMVKQERNGINDGNKS